MDTPVPRDPLLASDDVMTAEGLADAVERAARGMNQTALQRATGLSARTVRDVLSGNPARSFGRTTLDKLDGPLGWAPGTAWRKYREDDRPDDGDTMRLMEMEMERLVARVAALEEGPSWASEVVDAFRLLPPEVRSLLIELAWRLSRG